MKVAARMGEKLRREIGEEEADAQGWGATASTTLPVWWRGVGLCSRVTSSPFPLLDPTLGPLMSSAAHVLLVCVLWTLLVSAIDRVR